MALALTLNGTTTTTIPGSPANGDRIAMSNGTIRLSFTWNTHGGARWNVDLVEYSANGGSTWTSLLYGRDTPRCNLPSGESPATNGALSIITNTASTLKLQLLATTVVTNTYTFTITYTMTTAQNNVEVSQYLASSAQLALGANQLIEDYGACWFSAGLSTSAVALFDGIGSSFSSSRVKPALYAGNLATAGGRQYARAGNTSRGYGGGMALLLSTGHLCSFVVSPLSAQNAFTNIKDPNTNNTNVQMDWQNCYKGYVSWFKTTDAAYQAIHDFTPVFVRPGTEFTSGSASTFPQSASTTDAATTLNLTWSLCIEVPATGGVTGLPIPRYILPQRLNYWQDTLYPRPNIGGAGILGGGSGPMWQSLATLENTITPALAHTYTTYYDATYGYWEHDNSATLKDSITSAMALQTCLRWLNLGVGNADAQTMADQLAVVLANYQTQNGVQTGAFQKIRDTTNNVFKCQEANHAANTDQPHVSTYCMADILVAMIEYYRVRGNQNLMATYGTISVAALLDQAMAYLILVQQSDGGWLVEYSNTNAVANANANGGASYPGSATVDLAASMYQWSQLSPTASQANKTKWQQQATRAAMYYMLSESVPHGNYEFGEGYTTWSHHATKQLVRGFARLYRLTGSAAYLEHMAYYFDCAVLLCKKADDVVSNSASNNQPIHTGGLISTIDWNGVDSGEAACDWAVFLTEGAALYPELLAHHCFYMYANIAHETWGYRDVATYQASYLSSYAYCSPGTNYAGNANGLDNTRFLYFMASGALMLLAAHTAVACDNANVLATCVEANLAADTPAGRTIVLYNPQGTSQAVNLTVKGQAGKVVSQDGTSIVGSKSGSDMLVALTLTAGQITKVTTR